MIVMAFPENTWHHLGGSKDQGLLQVGGMDEGALGSMEKGFYLHTSVTEININEARLCPGYQVMVLMLPGQMSSGRADFCAINREFQELRVMQVLTRSC